MTGPWDNENGGRRDMRRPFTFWGHVWAGVTFWRVFAIVALLLTLGAVYDEEQMPSGPHVARLKIEGVIESDPSRDRLINRLRTDEDVKGLVVHINSPGGTVTGSEELYVALREFGAKKPVVAVISEMAASGGYVAALGADRIYARQTSITGSIGVLMEYPKIDGLLRTVGVEMHTIKSSPIKAEPNIWGETPEAALEVHRAMIEDAYRWFRDLVGDRRKLEEAELDAVANGAIFSGRMAIELKLVDEIGGERAAVRWMDETFFTGTKVRAAKEKKKEEEPLLLQLLRGGAALAGIRLPESFPPATASAAAARRALEGPRLMAILD